MQWPGTGAVLEKAEREETVLAQVRPEAGPPAQVPEDVISPALAGDPFSMEEARNDLELPCRDDPELFFAESPDDVEFAVPRKGLSCVARLAWRDRNVAGLIFGDSGDASRVIPLEWVRKLRATERTNKQLQARIDRLRSEH